MSKELRWEFYPDKKGEWRWRTFAKNGGGESQYI